MQLVSRLLLDMVALHSSSLLVEGPAIECKTPGVLTILQISFFWGVPSSCTTLVLPGKLSTLYLSSKCDYDHEYDTEYDDGYERSL
jgi:hypothetical protein